MKLFKLIIVVIVFTATLKIQGQAGISTIEKSKDIKINFSVPSLTVYQGNSYIKVKDFFQYLELLSGADKSEELQNQIKENIYSLFLDDTVKVFDISKSNFPLTDLKSLLNHVEKSGALQITIKEETFGKIYHDYWEISYQLEVRKKNQTQNKYIKQKVYFSPQIKDFGKSKKEVWTISLGEMEE